MAIGDPLSSAAVVYWHALIYGGPVVGFGIVLLVAEVLVEDLECILSVAQSLLTGVWDLAAGYHWQR